MDTGLRDRLLLATAGVVLAAVAVDGYLGGIPGSLGRDLGLIIGLRAYSVLAYGGVLAGTYLLARMLASRRTAWIALLFVGISQLLNHAIIGWNHTISTFVVLLATILTVRYWRGGSRMDLYAVAAVIGAGVWMRYPLIALAAPLIIACGVRALGDRAYLPLALSGIIGLSVLSPIAGFQQAAYGDPLTTAYELRPQALPPNNKPDLATSFDPARLVHTVPSMLIRFDPTSPVIDPDVPDFDYRFYKSSLLETSPYLILALIGLPVLYRRRRGEAVLLMALCGAPVLLYGSWIYFSGGWTTNMRYLSPMLPSLSVLAAMGLPGERLRSPWAVTGLIGVVAVLIGSMDGMTEIVAVDFSNLLALSVAALLMAVAVLDRLTRLEGGWATVFVTATAMAIGAVRVAYLGNLKLFYGRPETMLGVRPVISPLLALAAGICIIYGLWVINERFSERLRG